MAKKFEALRSRMPPAPRTRAALRAQTMLVQMPPQGAEISVDEKIREINQAGVSLPKDSRRPDRTDR